MCEVKGRYVPDTRSLNALARLSLYNEIKSFLFISFCSK